MDVTVPLTGGTVLLIIGWVGQKIVEGELKRRAAAAVVLEAHLKAHDDHVKKCDGERAAATAVLTLKVDTIAERQHLMEQTLTGIGGGIDQLLKRGHGA